MAQFKPSFTGLIKLPKRAYLIIFLLIILSLVVISFLLQKHVSPSLPQPPLSPNKLPSLSPSPHQSDQPGDFLLTNTQPPLPNFTSAWSVVPITLTFNQPINSNTFSYEISPQTATKSKHYLDDPNSITIIPLEGWRADTTYTLIVDPTFQSLSGTVLSKPLVVEIVRTPPPPNEIKYPPNQGI